MPKFTKTDPDDDDHEHKPADDEVRAVNNITPPPPPPIRAANNPATNSAVPPPSFGSPMGMGGGFGGKQDFDEILAAAYCAHQMGRPVKLIQTRETNFATSFPRTPTYHRMRAGLKNGQLTAVNHDIVSGWMGDRFGVGKKHGSDWLQLDSWDDKKQDIDQWSIGGSDHWYDMPNHRVRAWNHDKTTWAVQASALRTVSNSYNIFVVESMLDEIAHAAGRDPVEMRLAMLNEIGRASCRERV